jgi:hypothetical protein
VHAFRAGLLSREDVGAVVDAARSEFGADSLVTLQPTDGTATDAREAFRRDCEVASVVMAATHNAGLGPLP